MCKIGSTTQNDWYFFSHKDKKYSTSTRTNRATAAGFWKATQRDKAICSSNGRGRIGMRKTLVSCGMEKTCKLIQDEGWVICRIFKKKTPLIKTLENPIITTANSSIITTTTTTADDQTTAKRLIISSNISNDEGTLEEIINMGRTSCKVNKKDATDVMRRLLINPTVVVDTTSNNDGDRHQHNEYFVKLPNLETTNSVFYNSSEIGLGNWACIDDPLAMDFGSLNSSIDHYDDHLQILHQFPLFSTSSSLLPNYYTPYLFNAQTDHLWSSTRSSLPPSSPVCDMSDSPV
ncbi:hypothetical protein LguiA_010533 [Lonicera macranthoides]